MESFEVETFCTMLAQKSQSQREDQDLASQIVVAKGERGILTEQLALKLLRSFRGLYRGVSSYTEPLIPALYGNCRFHALHPGFSNRVHNSHV